MQFDETSMSGAAACWFRTFREIHRSGTKIRLLVRAHGAMVESWRYFNAQPAPTPPSWWRYSDRVAANEHVIDQLPPADPYSDLGMHLRARDSDFEPIEPARVVRLPRFNQYVDGRQYEVFTVGALLRQADAQNLRYERYYYHRYSYNLVPVENVAPGLSSSNTFLVSLSMHSRREVSSRTITHVGNRWAPGPSVFPLPSNSDPASFRTDTGIIYPRDETDAPGMPEVNSDVTIIEPYDRFLGSIMSVDRISGTEG